MIQSVGDSLSLSILRQLRSRELVLQRLRELGKLQNRGGYGDCRDSMYKVYVLMTTFSYSGGFLLLPQEPSLCKRRVKEFRVQNGRRVGCV